MKGKKMKMLKKVCCRRYWNPFFWVAFAILLAIELLRNFGKVVIMMSKEVLKFVKEEVLR